MPDRPSPEDALAAAVRERLAAGAEVPLGPLGTLRRTHEPARVEVRDDGSRVLHPPRHGVGLEPPAGPPDRAP